VRHVLTFGVGSHWSEPSLVDAVEFDAFSALAALWARLMPPCFLLSGRIFPGVPPLTAAKQWRLEGEIIFWGAGQQLGTAVAVLRPAG
jgi:hypothetical protein